MLRTLSDICLSLSAVFLMAATVSSASEAESIKPERIALEVDGKDRCFWVLAGTSASKRPSPVILFFHAYGGNAEAAALNWRCMQKAWPEATLVFPQGLPFPSKDPKKVGKPGWQRSPDDHGKRDLRFVDAILDYLQDRYRVDEKRVFACGYSNGGFFSFVLFVERPERFAAFGPMGCKSNCVKQARTPRPVFYVFGKQDRVLGINRARTTLRALLRVNRCGRRSQEVLPIGKRFEPEAGGSPVLWYLYDGPHKCGAEMRPKIAEAMVAFFKECTQTADPQVQENAAHEQPRR